MLTNLIVVIIVQHIHISNHSMVHCKLTRCYMSIIVQKSWKKINTMKFKRRKKNLISANKNTAVVFSVASGAKPTIKLTLPSYMSTLSSLDVPQFPLV